MDETQKIRIERNQKQRTWTVSVPDAQISVFSNAFRAVDESRIPAIELPIYQDLVREFEAAQEQTPGQQQRTPEGAPSNS